MSSIIISNIPDTISVAQISELFSTCGLILSINLLDKRWKTNKDRKIDRKAAKMERRREHREIGGCRSERLPRVKEYCKFEIIFESEDSVRSALMMDGILLHGCILNVEAFNRSISNLPAQINTTYDRAEVPIRYSSDTDSDFSITSSVSIETDSTRTSFDKTHYREGSELPSYSAATNSTLPTYEAFDASSSTSQMTSNRRTYMESSNEYESGNSRNLSTVCRGYHELLNQRHGGGLSLLSERLNGRSGSCSSNRSQTRNSILNDGGHRRGPILSVVQFLVTSLDEAASKKASRK